MTGVQAMEALVAGKKVQWKFWNSDDFIHVKDGKLFCGDEQVSLTGFILDNADGWSIYDEPGHDFLWAVQQMKDGKMVKRTPWVKVWWYEWNGRVYRQAQNEHGEPLDLVHFEHITAADWVLA
jgi:hypothetical protein